MSDDPGRDKLLEACEAGLITPQMVEELDAWATALAREMRELSFDELEAKILARAEADTAKRGRA